MEKIVTILWRPDDQAKQPFADALLETAAPRLQELGARKLKVCVEDDDVEGDALRNTPQGAPKAGMVSYWLECAQDRDPIEQVLADASSSLAAFLVVESQPIVNTEHVARPGERSPGMAQVTGIVPKEGLPYEEFIRIWHTRHRWVAAETQSTFQYVRNEVVRRLSGDAPPWAAFVEESFPIEAMRDSRVFYDAVGDEAKYQQNLKRMMESCEKFLQLDRVDVTIMSEYVFER